MISFEHQQFSWQLEQLSFLVSMVVVVWLMNNEVWDVGFGICGASIFIGILSITAGISTYRINVLVGSPLTRIAQVMIMKNSTNYLFNQTVMVYVINLGLFIN